MENENKDSNTYFVHFKTKDKVLHVLPVRGPSAQSVADYLRGQYEGCYICTIHLGVSMHGEWK